MPQVLESRLTHEKVIQYEDGEFIFEEGDTSRDLFIIQEGEVEIFKKTDVGDLKLAVFQRGDFFGDMALLQGGHRFAGAKAKGKTKLLVLQPGGFLLKIRRDPTFAFEMLQALSLRIKVSNERLIEVIKKGNIPKEMVEEILQLMSGR
ncbi:MAG: cyclic nucleotide-binding domain-containing protein [Bacteriovoracia bacterium]